MSEYVSIKEDVLQKLEANLPGIRDRFGIETLSLFGSVSRNEDSINSDVDIAYTFQPGKAIGIFKLTELIDFLEELLGRRVDFIPLDYMKPDVRSASQKDMIPVAMSSV